MWDGASWLNLSAVNASSHTITASSRTTFGDYSAYAGTGYITLKAIIQGRYRSGDYLGAKDSLSLYLANAATPYAFIDSAKVLIDSLSFTGTGAFAKAASGSYYLAVKHKSCLETWSAGPVSFVKGSTVFYDFTDAQNKAYGDNLIQVSSSPVRWAMFSGDINGDGFIDPLDLSIIDQASYNYVSGYGVATDVNGDGFVDPLDLSIVDQNSSNYAGVQKP